MHFCKYAPGSFAKASVVSYSLDLVGCLVSEAHICPRNTPYSTQRTPRRGPSSSSPSCDRVSLILPRLAHLHAGQFCILVPKLRAPGRGAFCTILAPPSHFFLASMHPSMTRLHSFHCPTNKSRPHNKTRKANKLSRAAYRSLFVENYIVLSFVF